MSLVTMEYKTITNIEGPLIFLEKTHEVGFGELVDIKLPDGRRKQGQVLDTSRDAVVVQVFEGTSGIDRATTVRFHGETFKLPVAKEMLGRVFSGSGQPLDGLPEVTPDERIDILGAAINPHSRASPKEFIQTGISTIDGNNTLVRGQKLPIFSGSGLPHNEIALQIASQARVLGKQEQFAVVFAAMGITNEESQTFIEGFRASGALPRAVLYLNLADDPAVERIITPRLALTTAEYLAFEHGYHILVILTDMTNYCEALRQIGAAREEIPGRMGYPGYMYTDLASIYERAGLIRGKSGSVTQIPILTMPGDDITNPVPDLTGYITEGQIVISREIHRKGIYPSINVLPSLSRLMKGGIGEGHTREDHKVVSDQLYAGYAEGKDLRGLEAIVGRGGLSERDVKFLDFADAFEDAFVRQGRDENRSIFKTLEVGWKLLADLPETELTRIDEKWIKKYHPKYSDRAGWTVEQLEAEEAGEDTSTASEPEVAPGTSTETVSDPATDTEDTTPSVDEPVRSDIDEEDVQEHIHDEVDYQGENADYTGFCLKCKKEVTITEPEFACLSSNRLNVTGPCGSCGQRVARILRTCDEEEAAEEEIPSIPDEESETVYRAFCMKCGDETPVTDAELNDLDDDRVALFGSCSGCGTKVTRILKKGTE